MDIKASELLGFLGSFIGLLTVLQTMMHSLLPAPLMGLLCRLKDTLSRFHYVDVPEYDESCLPNELYAAIKLHLSANITAASTHAAKRLKLFRAANACDFTWSPGYRELIPIVYDGAHVWWEHYTSHDHSSQHNLAHQPGALWGRPSMPDEKRTYILKLHKKDKDRVLGPYMDHILQQAREIRHHNRERLLYTNGRNDSYRHPWDSVPFKHPSTFATLALDPAKKQLIQKDLQAFAKGEEFYKRTGRAWKRGYLLYGPPGTGKSSLIAAMANLLRYDVYDLELTQVRSNAELRKLLLRTTSKSIIVIEDIDCSLDFGSRISSKQTRGSAKRPGNMDAWRENYGGTFGGCESRGAFEDCTVMQASPAGMTLSGLLNFTDGLWSCCGDERIFVFTTNHIENLDPALLRSGRMDMHIHMSYCTFDAFKILTLNYLGIQDNPLFHKVEEVIERAHITPAEVSEVLIRNKDSADAALEELLLQLEALTNLSCGKPTSPPAVEELANASSLMAKPWSTCTAPPLISGHLVEEEEQVKRAVQESMNDVLADVGTQFKEVQVSVHGTECPNCKHVFTKSSDQERILKDVAISGNILAGATNGQPQELLLFPFAAQKKVHKAD